MKSLKPSARENRRYLIVKGKNLKKNIEKAILEYVGVKGLAESGLNFIKSGQESAIISVNRKAIHDTRASLCVFSEKMSVEKVSGTLKGLSK
jgi:RNase P/RNase MRP subunit POP5